MPLYADNDFKFVAVLNGKIEVPKLLNALGHISVGITSLQEDLADMHFLKYYDADGTLHPAISKFPFIVLKAKNGNQIRTLRQSAMELGILSNDFTSSMLGRSAEEQQLQTKNSKESELEYFGICLFGKAEQLNLLTKKFSLFR